MTLVFIVNNRNVEPSKKEERKESTKNIVKEDNRVDNNISEEERKSRREFTMKCMKRINDTPSSLESGHKERTINKALSIIRDEKLRREHFYRTTTCKYGNQCSRKDTCIHFHEESERRLPMCYFLQYCTNPRCRLVHPTEEEEFIRKNPYTEVIYVRRERNQKDESITPKKLLKPREENIVLKKDNLKKDNLKKDNVKKDELKQENTVKTYKLPPGSLESKWKTREINIIPSISSNVTIKSVEDIENENRVKEEKDKKEEENRLLEKKEREKLEEIINKNPFYRTLPCKFGLMCKNVDCNKFHKLEDRRYPMCKYELRCRKNGCILIHDDKEIKVWDRDNNF